MLTDAILKLLHLPWKRGKKVPQTTQPDGVLTLQNNVVMNWEMFTGEQSTRQLKDRVRVYGRTEEFVVWIAAESDGLDRLQKYCGHLRNPLFGLLGQDDLTDLQGNTVSLEALGKSQG